MSQSHRKLYRFLGLVGVILLLLSGCAGSGEELDEEGNPIGVGGPAEEDELPFTPTFSSIQTNIFVPFCVCHVGAAAPQGLVLNTDATWDLLVAVSSNEIPDLFRVEPGAPADSYLIRKLEGGPDIVGFRMPPTELGEAHRPQEEIDVIRQWILDGALDD